MALSLVINPPNQVCAYPRVKLQLPCRRSPLDGSIKVKPTSALTLVPHNTPPPASWPLLRAHQRDPRRAHNSCQVLHQTRCRH